MVIYGQDITSEILNGFQRLQIFHYSVKWVCRRAYRFRRITNKIYGGFYQYECTQRNKGTDHPYRDDHAAGG